MLVLRGCHLPSALNNKNMATLQYTVCVYIIFSEYEYFYNTSVTPPERHWSDIRVTSDTRVTPLLELNQSDTST